MPTFDEVEQKGRPRSKGCPRCGKDNKGNVSIYLQELPLKKARRVRGRSISLCEGCAVEIYMNLEKQLLDEVGIQ